MKHITFPLILALAVAAAASAQRAPDWPQWRGPNGGGVSAETGWNPAALQGGAKILWKADVGYGYSNVIIKDGRLYAMGSVSRKGLVFFCFDAATGAALWQQAFDQGGIYDNPEPLATPVTDGERVYGISTKGVLLCLRSTDGQILWTRDLVAEFSAKAPRFYGWVASPIIKGDLLIINASQFGIALNKNTGDPVWVTAVDPSKREYLRGFGSLATPVACTLNGIDCVLFINEYALIAVDLVKGKTLWSHLTREGGHEVQEPIAFDNRVLLEGHIELDCSGTTPSVRWEKPSAVENDVATPVLVDGYLYGYQWDYNDRAGAVNFDWVATRRIGMLFRCVDWNTGDMLWEKIIMGGVSAIAVDGKLLMLDLDGMLRVVNASPAGYEELAVADVLGGAKRPRVFPTPPAFCNGRIYCRNYAGDLVCIDVSK